MCKRASPFNLSSPIVDCKYVFNLRNAGKLLLASHDVTGIVHNILGNVARLEKTLSSQLFEASSGLLGRSLLFQLGTSVSTGALQCSH